MSKKYFASYLPIDGDITPGDLYYQSYSESQIGVANKYDWEQGAYKDMRKAALYLLCRHDLQIGDKVVKLINTYDEGYGIIHDIKEDKVYVKLEEVFDEFDNPVIPVYNKNSVVKIIGIISLYYTWVNQFDEFEDDDIDIINWTTCELPSGKKIGTHDSIMIKCPTCKNFH